MALMSPPIAVADATAVRFDFSRYRDTVNVQVRFYSDAAGETELSPLGTGSRDLAITNTSTAFAGAFANPEVTQTFDSDVVSLAAVADGLWTEVDLGGGMNNITVTAAVDVSPGTAVTYRIIVDAPGSSAFA